MSGDKRKLPEGWKWKRLGRKEGITEIVNGSTPYTDVPEYWDGNILWVTPSDLGNFHSIYIENTERKITQAGLDSCSTTLLPVGTILLTSRAPVGNLAIANKPLCTNQGFKSFIPKDNINSLYLYFAIKKIIPDIQKMSHGNTFTEITKELVQDFEIPLPSTPADQLAIASDIERRMAHVEKMRAAALRQKEAIAAMQGAILRDFFFTINNDQWHLIRMSQIAHIIMGQSPDGSSYNKECFGIPLLNGPTEFGDEHPTPIQWTTSPNKMCHAGDLIVCVRGNTTGKMNWADQDYCLGRGVAGIRGKEEKGDTNFIKYALEYKINELLVGSERSTFPNLGTEELNSFEIFAPKDVSIQKKVAETIKQKVGKLNQLIHLTKSQLSAIEALPGAILREVFDFEEENTGS